MGQREDLIKRYKADVERMRESIQWMESGNEDLGEKSSSGKITSLKAHMIRHYWRTIEMIEGVVAKLESKDW